LGGLRTPPGRTAAPRSDGGHSYGKNAGRNSHGLKAAAGRRTPKVFVMPTALWLAPRFTFPPRETKVGAVFYFHAGGKKKGGSATRPSRTEAGPMQLESVPPVLLDCQRKRCGRADATAGSGDRHRGSSGRRAGGSAATSAATPTAAATRDEEQAKNH
jgi:hypothetical protein